ncbi:MAG TPA: hypothetical protein DDW82_07135 [Acholeplasmataceae bacterium]|nr:hypothetical protein [Acholeplasmataceae bacterium]
MPIVYMKLAGINCAGCLTTIESAVYRVGVTHFEYDVAEVKVKIVFEPENVSLDEIIETIHIAGFDTYVTEIIEYKQESDL